ncbi:Superoxide dismutase [Cu-Zn], variant 2, partial [Perkinsus olseni]
IFASASRTVHAQVPSSPMALLLRIGFLPFVAAQLPGNACDDLCSLIPGCTFKGSYCKDYQSPPPVCQDLYFIKTADSANATPCSVAFQKNCHEYYPVRCDDVLPCKGYSKGCSNPYSSQSTEKAQDSLSKLRPSSSLRAAEVRSAVHFTSSRRATQKPR